MTTPEDAKDIFAKAQAAFAPIVGAPNADNVKRLNKAFVNVLQSINVPDGAVDLSDILLSNDDHKANHRDRTFEYMEAPLKAYDNGITANTKNDVCTKAERLWTAKIELQRLIKTVERAGRAFLVAVIEETWLLPLKEESTFYNKVPLRDFFPRLKGGSGGLEATDIVSFFSSMLGWWANDPRVPEYINRLEDAQKKLVQTNLPINNMWLAAIVTGFFLAAESFPKQRLDWDSLPRSNKTWAAWKKTFHAHQLMIE